MNTVYANAEQGGLLGRGDAAGRCARCPGLLPGVARQLWWPSSGEGAPGDCGGLAGDKATWAPRKRGRARAAQFSVPSLGQFTRLRGVIK